MLRALTQLADALAKLRRRFMPAEFAALELGTMSWVTLALSAFCELGLPDALAAQPRSAHELAAQGFGRAELLERLLRSLAAYDVVHYRAGRYTLGRAGKALAGPASVAPMIRYANAPWHLQAYMHLPQTVRSGTPGFECAHGEGLFSYIQRDANAGAIFDEAMRSLATIFAGALVHGYDFSHIRTLIDVGGGTGAVAVTLQRRYPNLHVSVFELPAVAARGRNASPVPYIEGDIFCEVPPEADCYVLAHVLHDWGDGECEKILCNIRRAMTSGSKLIVYELVAPPPGNGWTQDRLSDLEMLAVLPGKERTREEFEALFKRCGLRLARVVATSAPESAIECVPDETPGR